MLDTENLTGDSATGETTETAADPAAEVTTTAKKTTARKTTAKKTTAKKAPAKKTTAKRTTKKTAAAGDGQADAGAPPQDTAEVAAPADTGSSDTAPADTGSSDTAPADQPVAPEAAPRAKKAAAKRTTTKKTTAKKTPAKRTTKKAAAAAQESTDETPVDTPVDTLVDAPVVEALGEPSREEATAPAEDADADTGEASAPTPPAAIMPLFQPPQPTRASRRRKAAAARPSTDETPAGPEADSDSAADETPADETPADETPVDEAPAAEAPARRTRKRTTRAAQAAGEPVTEPTEAEVEPDQPAAVDSEDADDNDDVESGPGRRRRRRGGRRRRKSAGDSDTEQNESPQVEDRENRDTAEDTDTEGETGSGSRRRRRRRRAGDEPSGNGDDPQNTVTRVRKARSAEDEITSVTGSTRLEAKKQRRREGREAGRRRAPIVSEAEFLARREAVDRVMVIRQKDDLTQIAVLEDKVLVEHYVARESQTSLIGNVYLGRVQNVLPSMEAAFIDIGKGRNAVLYAGEVNWGSLGAKDGQPRKIESVLKSGQSVLVQVTKDPIGHKGARLTSQISLPGRFLVYVPDGTTSGISRKLPDTERTRLKTLLKEIVPDTAGVIVRTAAEGASEDELTRDVERLTARWEDIQAKVKGGSAPQLLYGEPDLTLKVVRDLFTEDFGKLVVSGDEAWDMVHGYVEHVAPDLADRLERYDGDNGDRDVFAEYRIDEQIAKGLDRKVWLPSGGSLIIDRTEAMTVVDVNTGKFTGSGGNLEETVTKNNLEAAEEIVRQLRLRDIGGIIVVDFIDMVLESNRDLVLRRLVECLGRDRTRHQVAEVTSLGLVQMTRKRIGTGLLEAFSETCEHCQGRGVVVHHEPVETRRRVDEEPRRNRRSGRGRGRDDAPAATAPPSPKDIAAIAKPEPRDEPQEVAEPERPVEVVTAAEPEKPREQPPADQPAAQQPVEPEPAEAPAPQVRTRKRSAQRPQGPAGTAPAEPAAPAEPVSVPVAPVDGGAFGAETPSVPETGSAVGQPPAPPKVLTTVRRRSARRPAGPPSGAATVVSPAAIEADASGSDGLTQTAHPAPGGGDHDVDGMGAPLNDEQEPAAVHVPVKKKGSRKR